MSLDVEFGWKYVKSNMKDIPEEIITEYNLKSKEVNRHVYIEVQKEMYELPQLGLLSNKLLEKRLAAFGYCQSRVVPGLWKYKW